jgi:hypothetical protein
MTVLLIAMLLQTLVPVITPNTGFRISFSAEPQNAFRWWCDNGIVKNFATADLAKGPTGTDGFAVIEADVPGLSAGQHVCFVSAFNDAGEARSTPITVFVGTLPKTPFDLRIVVKVGG